MVAYKRSQNLANLLVRAKVTKAKQSSRVKNNGFKICERACEMCIRSQDVSRDLIKTHSCQRTGKSWPISAALTCLQKCSLPPYMQKVSLIRIPVYRWDEKTGMRPFHRPQGLYDARKTRDAGGRTFLEEEPHYDGYEFSTHWESATTRWWYPEEGERNSVDTELRCYYFWKELTCIDPPPFANCNLF